MLLAKVKYGLGVGLIFAHLQLLICVDAVARSEPMIITVAKGFGLSLFASNLGDARQLALGDEGTLFVGSKKSGTIQALVDSDGDGRVDKRYVIAKGLPNPEAIAFKDGSLYVALNERIVRYEGIESRLRRPGRPKTVYRRLPGNTNKSRRAMHFGSDGRLYVAIGSPCNVCEPEAPFGSIIAIDLPSGSTEQIATGVRSVAGFDWSPVDNHLWFADLGRDWMGDNIPADEINRVENKGEHFGFPYVHATDVIEPSYQRPENLKINLPVYELPAHVAPMGLLFYRGTQFPKRYHKQLFVTENGSWNRSSKVGYQVVMLQIEEKKVVRRKTLISFLDGEFPVARPHSMIMAKDGSLYISDDLKGNVYRLFYKEAPPKKVQDTEQ